MVWLDVGVFVVLLIEMDCVDIIFFIIFFKELVFSLYVCSCFLMLWKFLVIVLNLVCNCLFFLFDIICFRVLKFEWSIWIDCELCLSEDLKFFIVFFSILVVFWIWFVKFVMLLWFFLRYVIFLWILKIFFLIIIYFDFRLLIEVLIVFIVIWLLLFSVFLCLIFDFWLFFLVNLFFNCIKCFVKLFSCNCCFLYSLELILVEFFLNFFSFDLINFNFSIWVLFWRYFSLYKFVCFSFSIFKFM